MRPWLAPRPATAPRRQRAFTLIEGLVVVTIGALLLAVAVPSFVDYIRVQRLKAVAAQVVTDLQYARSEAIARSQWVRILPASDGNGSCYSIFTSAINTQRCNCLAGPSNACNALDPAAGAQELRTVSLPAGERVSLTTFVSVGSDPSIGFAFDHVTGGIATIPSDGRVQPVSSYGFDVKLDSARVMRVQVNRSGRVSSCIPAGSTIQGVAC